MEPLNITAAAPITPSRQPASLSAECTLAPAQFGEPLPADFADLLALTLGFNLKGDAKAGEAGLAAPHKAGPATAEGKDIAPDALQGLPGAFPLPPQWAPIQPVPSASGVAQNLAPSSTLPLTGKTVTDAGAGNENPLALSLPTSDSARQMFADHAAVFAPPSRDAAAVTRKVLSRDEAVFAPPSRDAALDEAKPMPTVEPPALDATPSPAAPLPMPTQWPLQPDATPTQWLSTPIMHEVGTPSWGSAVGDKVVWMLGQQQQTAEIHLHPPALGPLEVRLSMSDGQASLNFTTQHVPVREALEAATPRLREMLGESGIMLANVSVDVGGFSQQPQPQSQSWQQPSHAEAQPGERGRETLVHVTPRLSHAARDGARVGLVDYFA